MKASITFAMGCGSSCRANSAVSAFVEPVPISCQFQGSCTVGAVILGQQNEYEFIKTLGHGTYGIVFEAFDRRNPLARHVAIKMPTSDFGQDGYGYDEYLESKQYIEDHNHKIILERPYGTSLPFLYLMFYYIILLWNVIYSRKIHEKGTINFEARKSFLVST